MMRQGRVRLADRPFGLRQIDRAVDGRRAQRRSPSGGIVLDSREIDDAGPDRAVVFQAPSLLPWLTARAECRARRRPRLSARQPRPSAARSSTTTSTASASADAMDKLRRRAVERHEAARRHRPRLCAVAQAAAARRAVRHARQPDPLGAAGSADGGVDAHPGHRDLRHPRRRRGDPARRPRGDDDQRPERPHRPHHRGRPAAPAHAPGAARASPLLRLPRGAPRLPRRIRARRHVPSRSSGDVAGGAA